MSNKTSHVYYDSLIDGMKLLSTDSARWEFFLGVHQYSKDGTEPEFTTQELQLSWNYYKPNIDANIQRYNKAVESGRKGGQAKAAKSSNPANNKPLAEDKPIQSSAQE